MRKTLKTMNPREAREHYLHLVQKRIYRAWLALQHAADAPMAIRRRAVSAARKAYEKSLDWANPQPWHIKAALERREKYGVGVAAAFLAAHGWDASNAHKALFGY